LSLDGRASLPQYDDVRGHLISLASLGLMLASAASAADEQPICADRPGKSTPACTVPAGHWQIETGLADWSLQKDGGERETSLVLGETTVKYGVTGSSDVEIDLTPWQRAASSGPGFHDVASGIGDVKLIYKQQVIAGDAVQVTVMPFVKAPTAKLSLGNGKWEGGVLLPVDYAIGKSPFSIELTPELDWAADADGHGHHAAMVQVASLGWQATDKLSLSAEIWGQWDWDPSGTTRQASADGSIAYLVNRDLQLDAGANFGLNRVTPDVEVYGGISVRF
jgi:hypothetical protein